MTKAGNADLPGAGLEPARSRLRGILSPLGAPLSAYFCEHFTPPQTFMCKKLCKSEPPIHKMSAEQSQTRQQRAT